MTWKMTERIVTYLYSSCTLKIQSTPIVVNRIFVEHTIRRTLYSENLLTNTSEMKSKMFKRNIIADAINKVDNIIMAGEDAASVYPAILNSKKITKS